jgi:hypothetical protein
MRPVFSFAVISTRYTLIVYRRNSANPFTSTSVAGHACLLLTRNQTKGAFVFDDIICGGGGGGLVRSLTYSLDRMQLQDAIGVRQNFLAVGSEISLLRARVYVLCSVMKLFLALRVHYGKLQCYVMQGQICANSLAHCPEDTILIDRHVHAVGACCQAYPSYAAIF